MAAEVEVTNSTVRCHEGANEDNNRRKKYAGYN
ncbi:hypothetical protein EYZ11_010232 [Aspergillus tanneri]|uniref:Uncharacterized protein n=1 Tax=Aspergillus tanneri TaxID=1220188 RepID=A0A4S3J7Z8_9EURO|nr:hypothetical protein EYZ11_010232 [Aspergillus tanneri]